jgi:hypothetical protein
MAAIDLIAEEPIRFVTQRIAHCDGGKFNLQKTDKKSICILIHGII